MSESKPAEGWCHTLGIPRPTLESVVGHREATTFSLFLVALLERGEPMTLPEVAARFEAAGAAERSLALASLKRCRPGRPPVYREGSLYHLDPHDDELRLWVFRLELRPEPVIQVAAETAEARPIAGPDVQLTIAELDEAWRDVSLGHTSRHHVVLAILEAHGGPMRPADVVAFAAARSSWHALTEDPKKFKRATSSVEILADGRWGISAIAGPALLRARQIVRDRIAMLRKYESARTPSAVFDQSIAESERKRLAHGAELAKMSRALLVAFPRAAPEVASLLDVGERAITTYVGEGLSALRSRLAGYDIIGAVDVRGLLRGLCVDPGQRRLADLSPPQKTLRLNDLGLTLKLTTAILVQGSCWIAKPFGEDRKLAEYLARGEHTKLCRRIEADVKSLYALYEYSRLHRGVRVRWKGVDTDLPAPWVDRDETRLDQLMASALAMNAPLEVVVGPAPAWEDPWGRASAAFVHQGEHPWDLSLLDGHGRRIDEPDVQRARIAVELH